MSHTSPLNVEKLESFMPLLTEQTYTRRDTILYALGVGAGALGEDADLKYIYEGVDEDQLTVLPTMAVAMAYPGFWQQQPKYEMDWQQILHADQKVLFHAPIRAEGRVRGVTTIEEILDKGADKGAVLYTKRLIYDMDMDELITTVYQGAFLRGNGGFSGKRDPSPALPVVPAREADGSLEIPIHANQPFIYRLSGDYNPIHVDPVVAREGGFEQPILHGLCTFGVAGRAVLRLLCGDDGSKLSSIGGRFTAPVYPGDTILTEVWNTADGEAMFRCTAKERGVIVFDHGTVELR